MTVAFVLSGGAGLGAIQVGMLRALLAHDVRPDVLVGTSVGAVNGAFVASRGLSGPALDELAALWRTVRRGQVFPLGPVTGLLGFVGARRSLVSAGALRRLLAGHVDGERLEDLPTPLHVIACDLLTGQEVRLSEGPLIDAVLASTAIPGVLPPVEWNGRLLVDGGIANNTPITHALELGADEVYVLPTGACALAEAPRGALGVAVQATTLMVARRFTDEALRYRDHAGLTILPPPCPHAVQPLDFSHADALMTRAEADARAFLAARRSAARARRGRAKRARGHAAPPTPLPARGHA